MAVYRVHFVQNDLQLQLYYGHILVEHNSRNVAYLYILQVITCIIFHPQVLFRSLSWLSYSERKGIHAGSSKRLQGPLSKH